MATGPEQQNEEDPSYVSGHTIVDVRNRSRARLVDTSPLSLQRSAATSTDTLRHSKADPNADHASLPAHSPSPPSRSESDSPAPDPDRIYQPHQLRSLAGIALRSCALGAALAAGVLGALATLAWTDSPLWRLPFFLAALAAFHFLEFWTTAARNPGAATVDAFLLTANGRAYAVAHAAACVECLATNLVLGRVLPLPGAAIRPALLALGLALMLQGQAVRTLAMLQAGPSFNHVVQSRRAAGHALVTTGVYARLRHPSYFGFFWWALGTQLVLGNAVCLVGYAVVLWRFFASRIRYEEESLVRFFGREYEQYRERVPTLIPLIP